MSSTVTELPAPDCTSWCTEHTDNPGWDYDRRDVTKVCRTSVTFEADGHETVELTRFAAIEDGRLVINDPEVNIFESVRFDLAALRSFGRLLGKVDEMAGGAAVTDPDLLARKVAALVDPDEGETSGLICCDDEPEYGMTARQASEDYAMEIIAKLDTVKP